MLTAPFILVINPGSTSTKVAIACGAEILHSDTPLWPPPGMKDDGVVATQVAARSSQIRVFLASASTDNPPAAIAARGGPLQPVPGGVYRINDAMLSDACGPHFVQHPSRLACIIAAQLAQESSVPAFVVDPISTDEFEPVARLSGCQALPRKSLTHALNMKNAARRLARSRGVPYESLNLVTAHLGGGISVAAHHGGRMIDSVDSNGEGPMSPQRSGGLRVDDLARHAINSHMQPDAFVRLLTRSGGLTNHLGTHDGVEIERRIAAGDQHALLVYQAMAYQIAKSIYSMAAALSGRVDGIILTGGLAHSKLITTWVSERTVALAPVTTYPGEFEMEALADGVARALAGEEPIRCYPTGTAE